VAHKITGKGGSLPFVTVACIPFTAEASILARYHSRHEYVTRVTRAADHLAAKGYITTNDRSALIAAAEDEPLPAWPSQSSR